MDLGGFYGLPSSVYHFFAAPARGPRSSTEESCKGGKTDRLLMGRRGERHSVALSGGASQGHD